MAGRITYAEAMASEYYSSRFSAQIKRVSVGIVVLLQDLPLTPNFFTAASTASVVAGAMLLVGGHPALFSLLMIAGFVFDQVDGAWARLKGQVTAFGAFIDPFADAIKYFAVDVAFITLSLPALRAFVPRDETLFALVAGSFAVRELYAAAALPAQFARRGGPMPVGLTGSAARFCVYFPLLAHFPALMPAYLAASFCGHALLTALMVAKRARLDKAEKTR